MATHCSILAWIQRVLGWQRVGQLSYWHYTTTEMILNKVKIATQQQKPKESCFQEWKDNEYNAQAAPAS